MSLFYLDSSCNILPGPVDKEYYAVQAFEHYEAVAHLRDHLNPLTPKNKFVVGHYNAPQKTQAEYDKETAEFIKARNKRQRKEYGGGSSNWMMNFISMVTGGFTTYE